jgi:isopenicillin-N epimerase
VAPSEKRLAPDSAEIDMGLVEAEWPASQRDGIYFNSGSCGVKPLCVLNAIEQGYRRLNANPTIMTFVEHEIWNETREQARHLFGASEDTLFLTQNSTFGIQLIMQSFLKNAGDEFVTTDQEHSCVKTLSRFLEERKGIVSKHSTVDPHSGSEKLCLDLLNLVGPKTKLVLVSQINCLNGWRPKLDLLDLELKRAGIPLLVDGAHAPGQGPLSISQYPLWVASGHKWMGAPNGTGFLHVDPSYMDRLEPVTIGDRFFDAIGQFSDRHKFEWPGTSDPVKWLGLQAALRLQESLGPQAIATRQKYLNKYLREALASRFRNAELLTPDADDEICGMVAVRFRDDKLRSKDLRAELWKKHRIWVQPDFSSEQPGAGMRLSCHPFVQEPDIEKLASALTQLIN